jgi:TetR/AcrR family transcriptional regulator
MTEFATKGYDGARVDSIARSFGLSKNMLYHYFGSKEGLFIAVLEDAYERFRARQQDFEIDSADPVEAMRRLIVHTFSAFIENEKFIALLNSENLHKGRHIRRSRIVKSLYNPLIDKIRKILRDGVAQGVFKRNIDPIYVYISFSALAYHYISNRHTLNAILGIDFATPRRRAAWRAYISELILNHCAVAQR